MRIFALLFAFASTAAYAKTDLWVYTSIYKEFIAAIEVAFEKAHPEIDVQVFQAGSEKIQAKVEAEIVARAVQADIMLTSDPFWSHDLARRGLAFERPGHRAVEENYNSLMVMIAHKDMPQDKRPSAFADLARPEYKGLTQLGSPLESGTTFSTVAYLARKYGWEYFEKLRANGVASAGGNSNVIAKVETGEKKIGVVLLENALAARKRGSPFEIIYPADGAIPIPSVQVIMKDGKNKDAAVKFADFILSDAGQQLLVNGYMYSINPKISPPEGARPLAEVAAKSTPWTEQTITEVGQGAKDIKKKFAALILE